MSTGIEGTCRNRGKLPKVSGFRAAKCTGAGSGEALSMRFSRFAVTDAMLPTFGVMFAPDHARGAAEMARAVHPGGAREGRGACD